nr:copia protein [Tanacetum cinerariifolium]
MELYIENRENGRIILKLVLNGPLVWPTIDEENGTTRTKKYEELSVAEKFHANCDLKATNIVLQDKPNLEDLTHSDDADDVGAEADINNLESIISEPKQVHQTLKDPSWIDAMQEELLRFKMQKVWILVDLPYGKRAIGTNWVYRNKKDKRGIVIKNKARLVAQGHTQEEGIDYEEVFAPVAKVEAIRLFLAYASFMGFLVYQMDVKNMPALEEIVYSDDAEDFDVEADSSNLEINISVSPIPTTRVHKDHFVTQIIGDLTLAPQKRSMVRMLKEQGGLNQINDEDFHTYLPKGKRAIGSKWVFTNKKDERGIVIWNKARLVAQGHTQEEGIDYDEIFAPVARIEAI